MPFWFAGKRQCPTYQFAYLEIMFSMATILPCLCYRLVDHTSVEGEMVFATNAALWRESNGSEFILQYDIFIVIIARICFSCTSMY